MGVDQGSELIRRIVMTPAHVHDGEMLPHVICADEGWVFADKAYDSKKNHRILQKKERSKRNHDEGNQKKKT